MPWKYLDDLFIYIAHVCYIDVKYLYLIQIVKVIRLVERLKTGFCKPDPAPGYVSFVTLAPSGDLITNMEEQGDFT